MIVSDKNPATAVTAARRVPMPDRSEREDEPVDARREARPEVREGNRRR